MSTTVRASVRSVAFLGNSPPRQCGIATFTHDIFNAVADRYPNTNCRVCAVTDPGQSYSYPDSVTFEIDEQEPATYLHAADLLNMNNTDVICIQHEFGIYGGASGSYVLDFARAANAPIVTTFHTILEHPTPKQDRVLRELVSLSSRVIVMSARGKELLSTVYDVPTDLIDLIPHGIPDMPFEDSSFYKDKIGVEGKFVLLTFGLLSPNKGIENVIEALPSILKEFPDVVYVVLGATHPQILRTEGDTYRHSLEKRVVELGIEHAMKFDDRFVEIEELKEYIAAADMYITPYLNAAQIISGTLAYSFGCGKAVISTPYQHAIELLADDCGIIVPFADPSAISREVLGLLRDDGRRNAMRKRAYLLGRDMIWSEVADRYMESFEMARLSRSTAAGKRIFAGTAVRSSLMSRTINIDHLRRMTDSTGLVQHARYSLPHYPEGYCTDDNARALTLTVALEKGQNEKNGLRTRELIATYASFLNGAFNTEIGKFRNFMSYDRKWLDDCGSDDCQGRSIMALATCISANIDSNLRHWATGLFQSSAIAILTTGSPRGWANALLGMDTYLLAFPGDRAMRRIANELVDRLVTLYNDHATPDWPWFEPILAYDNTVLAQALILRGRDNPVAMKIGLDALRWLVSQQASPDGHFRPIGSDGFYPKGGERAQFDQQPIEVEGMVSASLSAYHATNDTYWLDQMYVAYDWFHGRNDNGMSLIDPISGACHDGLSVDRINRNQGAESTLSYLSARMNIESVQPPVAVEVLPALRVMDIQKEPRLAVNGTGRNGFTGRTMPEKLTTIDARPSST